MSNELYFRIRQIDENKYFFVNTQKDATLASVKSTVSQLSGLNPVDFELAAAATATALSGGNQVRLLDDAQRIGDLQLEMNTMMFILKKMDDGKLEEVPSTMLA